MRLLLWTMALLMLAGCGPSFGIIMVNLPGSRVQMGVVHERQNTISQGSSQNFTNVPTVPSGEDAAGVAGHTLYLVPDPDTVQPEPEKKAEPKPEAWKPLVWGNSK